MSKIAKWFVVCALVLSIGGHWAILQSVAWVSMTINFSKECSFSQAIEKTFDGHHPCKLCCAVRDGKKAEAKQEAKIDLKKVDFASDTVAIFQFPEPIRLENHNVKEAPARSYQPHSPPPRSLFV